MAMTPKLWSISGLATELQLDRRTIARRLQEVPPRGKIAGGHDGWHLADAIAACSGKAGKAIASATEQDEALAALTNVGPRIMCLTAPSTVARLMVEVGLPLQTAFVVSQLLADDLAAAANQMFPGSVGEVRFDELHDVADDDGGKQDEPRGSSL